MYLRAVSCRLTAMPNAFFVATMTASFFPKTRSLSRVVVLVSSTEGLFQRLEVGRAVFLLRQKVRALGPLVPSVDEHGGWMLCVSGHEISGELAQLWS